MVRKTIFGILLTAMGCTTTDKKAEQEHAKADTVLTARASSKSSADRTMSAEGKQKVDSALYEYQNDTLSQSLTVRYVTREEIAFRLTSFNKANNQTSSLAGTAQGKLNQDPEMDEDDEGNAYAVAEYRYGRDECSLSIRIGMDDGNKAKVFEYHCDKLHESTCPLGSAGVLKKISE